MKPEEVIAQAIANALDTLKRTGCAYKVTDRFGKTHSNIVRSSPVHDYSPLKIPERIGKAKAGEILEFDTREFEVEDVRARICSEASKRFGRRAKGAAKAYETSVDLKAKKVFVAIYGAANGLDEALAQLGAAR